jgi:hypothetical protein
MLATQVVLLDIYMFTGNDWSGSMQGIPLPSCSMHLHCYSHRMH